MASAVEPERPRLHEAFRRASRAAFAVIVTLGALVLVGWALDIDRIKSVHPELAPMKANTALLFVMVGVGGLTMRRPRLRVACGAAVLVLAALVGSQHFVDHDLGIDQILFTADDPLAAAGRISVATVVCFLLLGAALLLFDAARARFAQLAVLPVMVIAFLSLTGYVYGVGSLHRVGPYAQIAFHTTLGLLVTAFGVVASHPDVGVMRIPTSDSTAGALLRRVLPSIILVPMALGALGLRGQSMGLYDSTFEVALQVAGSVCLLSTLIWIAAGSLLGAEERERDAEHERRARGRERDQIFELSIDPIFVSDTNGYWKDVNPAAERRLGFTKKELRAVPFIEFVHPEDRERTMAFMTAGVPAPNDPPFENRYVCKDGSVRSLEWHTWPEPAGRLYYSIAHDTTEARAIQQALRASLKEKEVLLQEVHHRVKNNMQVISSLINMQARTLPDGVGKDALRECQQRVQTIALIHEKLYQSRDYADVPFADYARGLAIDIVHAAAPGTVRLEVVAEAIHLPVDKAIPCGLILNELMTNALKHAFPAERRGTIRVELARTDQTTVSLAVTDDGVGLRHDEDPIERESLGMQIVRTLVGQLDGELRIDGHDGASFRVSFPTGATS